ncbi:hypothetical protein LCGC14_1251950, partial [marine sediment metagenome]
SPTKARSGPTSPASAKPGGNAVSNGAWTGWVGVSLPGPYPTRAATTSRSSCDHHSSKGRLLFLYGSPSLLLQEWHRVRMFSGVEGP